MCVNCARSDVEYNRIPPLVQNIARFYKGLLIQSQEGWVPRARNLSLKNGASILEYAIKACIGEGRYYKGQIRKDPPQCEEAPPRRNKDPFQIEDYPKIKAFYVCCLFQDHSQDREKLYSSPVNLWDNNLPPFLEELSLLFKRENWSSSFGGQKWMHCTNACIKALEGYKTFNLSKFIIWIDHMNDLEHNGGKFFSKFAPEYLLAYVLDLKFNDKWGVLNKIARIQ